MMETFVIWWASLGESGRTGVVLTLGVVLALVIAGWVASRPAPYGEMPD